MPLVGVLASMTRVGRTGPQVYHGYPGEMCVQSAACVPNCEFATRTASAHDLSVNLPSRSRLSA